MPQYLQFGFNMNSRSDTATSSSLSENAAGVQHLAGHKRVACLEQASVQFARADGQGMNTIFRNVSFDLRDGEMLVLVGRSGCGKTTALNLLAGLLQPTMGVVQVFDRSPKLGDRDVGYMFARDALLPWRTVVQNVELGLECSGVESGKRRKIAHSYLEMVHLSAYADNFPNTLSQGMRQRAALARTWATEPRLLLMDEPFAALDAQTRTSVRDEFVRLWERDRRSVVFVTHDLHEAIILADRIIVFANGRIGGEFMVPFERPRDMMSLAASDDVQALYTELRELLAEG